MAVSDFCKLIVDYDFSGDVTTDEFDSIKNPPRDGGDC